MRIPEALETISEHLNRKDLNDVMSRYKQFDSSVISDCLTHLFKSLLNKSSLRIEDLLSDKILRDSVNCIADYDLKKTSSFDSISEFLSNTLKDFPDLAPVSFDESVEFVASSFIEFDRMSFYSLRGDSEAIVCNKTLHREFFKFDSKEEMILSLSEKTDGFYFCKWGTGNTYLFAEDCLRVHYGIVSKQDSGLHVGEFYYESLAKGSLRDLKSHVFPIMKSHAYNGNISAPTITGKSVDIHEALNVEPVYRFIFCCYLFAQQFEECVSASVQQKLIGFGGSNHLPVPVRDFESQPEFTLDDLAFSDEMSFLSFLDERYKDLLEKHLSIINFSEDRGPNNVPMLWSKSQWDESADLSEIRKMAALDGNEKSKLDNFKIKWLKYPDHFSGITTAPVIRVIPKISASYKDSMSIAKSMAMYNKVMLISYFVNKEFGGYDKTRFLNKEISALLSGSSEHTNELVSLIGQTKFNKYHGIAKYAANYSEAVLTEHPHVDATSDSAMKNYNTSGKATKVIYHMPESYRELNRIMGSIDMNNFSDNAKFILTSINAIGILREQSKGIYFDRVSFSFLRHKPEWMLSYICLAVEFALPVSEAAFKKIVNDNSDAKFVKR